MSANDWPESPVDKEVAYLPSTPTDFDKELKRINSLSRWGDFQTSDGKWHVGLANQEELDELRKEAVDKYVIGEDQKYLRGYSFSRSDKFLKNAAVRIENELRVEQRQSLWGTK